jgi:hypothetical protein
MRGDDYVVLHYDEFSATYEPVIIAVSILPAARTIECDIRNVLPEIIQSKVERNTRSVQRSPPEGEASHIGFLDLVFAGKTEAAIAALYAHLTAWPRDALVVAVAANPMA